MSTAKTAFSDWWSQTDRDNFKAHFTAPPANNPPSSLQLLIGVSGLQSAFYIHHLLEIKGTLKEPKNVPCGKCIQSPQSSKCYCCDCGDFLCAMCYTVHSQWGDDFANHKVVAIEQLEQKVKQLDAVKKVTLYCSLHQGKELELYCETCEELIYHNCTISKHYRPEHKFDLVGDTIERHKAEIEASLEPIKMQMDSINKALVQLDLRSLELDNLLEGSIVYNDRSRSFKNY